ncbi:hypothetical protein FACS189434_00270 [Bacteroidia bacterium]|nr:hypothetical protein FACS189434_00270 [Bacteroidia bacterium]
MENQETSQNTWKRAYFQQPYKKPFLFYVIFGTSKMDTLSVSRNKHNIDGMPDELELINYNKTKDKDYIEGLYADYFGTLLKEKSADLYKKVKNCENITIVKGEFEDNETFDYLKNTIGIMQAIIETGTVAVLDMQILEWNESQEWTEKYFEPKAPQTLKQAVILFSEENGKIWLHTRGMRKFGRPDISIRNVTEKNFDLAKEITNRFIQAFSNGLIPNEKQEIWIKGMEDGVFGKILGDYDNLDFNNYYFEMEF